MSAQEECTASVLFKFESAGGILLELLLLVYLFYIMMILTDEFLMGIDDIEYIDITINKFSLSVEAGACLTDFTLCLAVACLTAAAFHGHLRFPLLDVFKDYLTYIACLVLVICIVSDLKVTALEAILLLSLTPCYVVFSFMAIGGANLVKGEKKEKSTQGRQPFKAPVTFICRLFVPDYSGKNWQIGVGFASIVFLGFCITRLTVFCLERIICHTTVSESLVGLTLISWGNNIGDIMNATVAAKRGNALLSISSILSTQILNLVFCLGLPWSISSLFFGSISMNDSATQYSLYFAFCIVTLSLLSVSFTGQRMQGKLGGLLLGLYFFYVITEWTLFNRG